MDLPNGLDFLIDRKEWSQTRFTDTAIPELADGQALFRVDRFAITANNVTYALAGDMIGYWNFFRAPEGMGRVPAMGFGDIIASRHPAVAEGTRCFGFYPMSRYLLIEPGSVSRENIMDGAAHRAALAPAYNQYSITATDALYEEAHEDTLMLLRGLFLTSFLAGDFLAGSDYFGAESVLISSASSKTSIALGFQVRRGGRARAIGLTSKRNLEFTRALGCYDEVLLYDDIRTLDGNKPAIFVDMAGNKSILQTVHEHWDTKLGHSCAIGMTHWQAGETPDAPLPGPKPEFFFAPTQIQKRVQDWGPAGFEQRLAEGWARFRSFTADWLEIRRGSGTDALDGVWQATLAGETDPKIGNILSLFEAE
jgi:hypothetical protein